jgi:hypothetical protein
MQDRVRTMGPQMMAQALSRFDPKTREALEQRLGTSAASLASGEGGHALLKLMEARRARVAQMIEIAHNPSHNKLSLEKEWHGVHYCSVEARNRTAPCWAKPSWEAPISATTRKGSPAMAPPGCLRPKR